MKAAIWLFCKQIKVLNKAEFTQRGPLLIVANHPNSFLDAILIGSFFKEKVHFLARGDAFRQKKHRFLLKMLKMIPVYRLSEGKENLYLNEYAFNESHKILQNGGIVLIFLEGICINSHQLQPFKKGAARIALNANKIIPLSILPISITYNSFSSYGKNICINAGNSIIASNLLPFKEEAKSYLYFNDKIKEQLKKLTLFTTQKPFNPNIVARLLAKLGRILHLPLYQLVSKIIRQKTKGTVFYDSVLFGVLMFVYPLYLFILLSIFYWITLSLSIVLLIFTIHVISARIAILYKQV